MSDVAPTETKQARPQHGGPAKPKAAAAAGAGVIVIPDTLPPSRSERLETLARELYLVAITRGEDLTTTLEHLAEEAFAKAEAFLAAADAR